jgi:hypothetical protein
VSENDEWQIENLRAERDALHVDNNALRAVLRAYIERYPEHEGLGRKPLEDRARALLGDEK